MLPCAQSLFWMTSCYVYLCSRNCQPAYPSCSLPAQITPHEHVWQLATSPWANLRPTATPRDCWRRDTYLPGEASEGRTMQQSWPDEPMGPWEGVCRQTHFHNKRVYSFVPFYSHNSQYLRHWLYTFLLPTPTPKGCLSRVACKTSLLNLPLKEVKFIGKFNFLNKQGKKIKNYNPSPETAKAAGSWVWSQLGRWLHSEFKDNLGYIAKTCLKKNK